MPLLGIIYLCIHLTKFQFDTLHGSWNWHTSQFISVCLFVFRGAVIRLYWVSFFCLCTKRRLLFHSVSIWIILNWMTDINWVLYNWQMNGLAKLQLMVFCYMYTCVLDAARQMLEWGAGERRNPIRTLPKVVTLSTWRGLLIMPNHLFPFTACVCLCLGTRTTNRIAKANAIGTRWKYEEIIGNGSGQRNM